MVFLEVKAFKLKVMVMDTSPRVRIILKRYLSSLHVTVKFYSVIIVIFF